MSSILRLENINKHYKQAGEDLHVLKDINIEIGAGEIVALVGPSGSGKTTMMQISGLLDSATSGKIFIGGEDVSKADDKLKTRTRRDNIGFVYQFHHLLEEFDALENVLIPLIVAGNNDVEKAKQILEKVGLSDRLTHRPAQLSGGQQQRVAIARALVNDPKLLLADEPTGNLDHATADKIFDVMKEIIKDKNCGAIIATHNLELAARMDRTLNIQDGIING